jgi:hypothetical protein
VLAWGPQEATIAARWWGNLPWFRTPRSAFPLKLPPRLHDLMVVLPSTAAHARSRHLPPPYSLSSMLFTCYFKLIYLQLLFFHAFHAFAAQRLSTTSGQPEYVQLPDLQKQALIQDAWTKQRISNIPNILQKYGVDAWLVRLLFIAARCLSHVSPRRVVHSRTPSN